MAKDTLLLLQSLFSELLVRHEKVAALAKKHGEFLEKASSFKKGSEMNRKWARLAIENAKDIKAEMEQISRCSAKMQGLIESI